MHIDGRGAYLARALEKSKSRVSGLECLVDYPFRNTLPAGLLHLLKRA